MTSSHTALLTTYRQLVAELENTTDSERATDLRSHLRRLDHALTRNRTLWRRGVQTLSESFSSALHNGCRIRRRQAGER